MTDALYDHQIQSVIIEGGRQTLQTFIDANLWDEARVFRGTILKAAQY
jgi:diaminohydroxyphosphoribosylaminopyrimidine deaminase/5-amino-6-(5-phosphoribosylamino)uracil reductase